MKKIVIIMICLFLLLPAVNFGTSKTTKNNGSPPEIDYSIDGSVINNPQEQQILQNINRLDGFFTENLGQVGNDSIRYYIQGKGVWFLDDGVVFEITDGIKVENRESNDPFGRLHPELKPEIPQPKKSVVLKLYFEGSNEVESKGVGILPHKSNFFYGNDSSRWRTGVYNYQEILYENLYDNIDLRYYSSPKGLKYDFIVHPGGNLNDIKLRFEGAEQLFIDTNSDLVIQTQLGYIIDSEIFIYQNINGKSIKIEGRFQSIDKFTYGFKLLNEFDKKSDLIIDPLIYSTYIGGIDGDVGYAIEVDSNNSAYVTGDTSSSNFPYTTGAYNITYKLYDVFIIKLNHNGSELIYSTFIGGFSYDGATDLKIDENGSVYVVGNTGSIDFPTTVNSYDAVYNEGYDCFILKLNPKGMGVTDLNYSTFFGGGGYENVYGLALDVNNNIYITGDTNSNISFPITAGAFQPSQPIDEQDAFFAKINPAGNGIDDLNYSTFLGGSGPINFEFGEDITVDFNGYAYITGATYSTNFPTTANAYQTSNAGFTDGFITKINPAGGGNTDLLYSTYFGGILYDGGSSITLDSKNNAIVTGGTDSFNFPTTANAYDRTFNGGGGDVFVFKINPIAGASPSYSTFIGSTNGDQGLDITVDDLGDAYVTGSTSWTLPVNSDFPITNNSYSNTHNGGYDAFVLKLNLSVSNLYFSSFIGGGGSDGGTGIAIDSNLNIYLTGYCSEPNFPNTTGAFDQKFNGGQYDCFVCKLKINYMPSILDLNVSKPTVLRTNSVYLYSNSTDTEDIEKNLTPHFEYRDPNEQVWNNTNFSTPYYVNNRWESSFTPLKNATIGLYDLRVRVNDTTSIFSDWFILDDALLVMNNLPAIIDFKISNSTSIQNENISLWVNGTDIEAEEVNLTVEINYRDPSEIDWNISYLGVSKYNNNRLELNFSTPFGAPFGLYDFRARVVDNDGKYSAWLYLNDSLLVYNTVPNVLDIELSDNIVYRTNTVSLFVDGADYETSENILNCYIQIKPDSESKWTNLTAVYSNYNKQWQAEFVTDINSVLGTYDIRVKFEDNFNGSSGWIYLNDSLEVLNNPPEIFDTLDDINVGVWRLIDLSPYGIDIEDGDKNLTWNINETQTFSYIESISIAYPINNTLKIEPFENIVGIEDIELILTDKDGGATKKSDITIYIDSRITKFTPKVTLLSPIDNEIVTTLTPILEWDLNHSGSESITFHVYLDEDPEPTTELISGLDSTSFTLENELEEGKTYYWKVIPTEGICLSDPFSFTIDLDYMPFYKVNLSTERDYIPISRGQFVEVNLTIKNEGNIVDNYKIEYNSTELQPHINLDKPNVQLEPSFNSTLKLSMLIPYELEPDDYYIKITAVSLSDVNVNDEVMIKIAVRIKHVDAYIFKVNITVIPESIELEQGQSENVTLTIINEGNILDSYYIRFESFDFTTGDVKFLITSIELSPEEREQINVIITVPEYLTPGIYSIEFIVESADATDDTKLIIIVKEPDEEEEGSTDDDEDNTMLYASIGIFTIILIICFIVIFLFVYKKKLPKEEDENLEDEIEE